MISENFEYSLVVTVELKLGGERVEKYEPSVGFKFDGVPEINITIVEAPEIDI